MYEISEAVLKAHFSREQCCVTMSQAGLCEVVET